MCGGSCAAAVRQAGGREVDARGDELFAVFERAPAGLEAALAIQRAMDAGAWPEESTCGCESACIAGVPRSRIPATSASRFTPRRASASRRTAGRSSSPPPCGQRSTSHSRRGSASEAWAPGDFGSAAADGSLPGGRGRPAHRLSASSIGRPCRVTPSLDEPKHEQRAHQDVSASADGSDARRKRSVCRVSRIAVKPTMTLTQVRVSFMPTLKARSAECDARPRRV